MSDERSCDLCSDQPSEGELHLRAACHMTAPLSVSIDGSELILRCYVPSCNRLVAKFQIDRSRDDLIGANHDGS